MGAFIAWALVAATTAPADATPPWQGVWTGTVGSLPVRVCLARQNETAAIGSYFYLSRLRTIRLEQQGGSREWVEGYGESSGPPPPRWRFEAVGSGVLAGRWTGGGRALPFWLTRVAGADDDEPCGSRSYNAPRLRPLRVAITAATRDGVAYTKLRFDPGPAFAEIGLTSFALLGDAPATRRINARLRRDMPSQPERGEWYACAAGGLAAHGADGDYTQSIEPVLISPRWLAATEAIDYDCGGAHPDGAVTSLTFDRTAGAEVDLHDWLSPRVVERPRPVGTERPLVTLRPAFRRLIVARSDAGEAECRDAALAADYWDIGLARTGLRFTPELGHAEQACAEATAVPWRVLVPYLSAAGRAGAASLR